MESKSIRKKEQVLVLVDPEKLLDPKVLSSLEFRGWGGVGVGFLQNITINGKKVKNIPGVVADSNQNIYFHPNKKNESQAQTYFCDGIELDLVSLPEKLKKVEDNFNNKEKNTRIDDLIDSINEKLKDTEPPKFLKCPICGENLMYLMDGITLYCKKCKKYFKNNNGTVGEETSYPYTNPNAEY